jgi:hypothetical protein
VTAADTGLVIERYRELKSHMPLFLHFRDGTIFNPSFWISWVSASMRRTAVRKLGVSGERVLDMVNLPGSLTCAAGRHSPRIRVTADVIPSAVAPEETHPRRSKIVIRSNKSMSGMAFF